MARLSLAGGALVSYLGEFEQLVLFSVVELGGEAYGGAIRETIERKTGRVVSSGAINTAGILWNLRSSGNLRI